MKVKVCKVCEKEFTPFQTMQKVCDWKCALVLSREKRAQVVEKAKRHRLREGREKLKTRSDHLREAQTAFNAYIRERDKGRPCISCGRHHTGQYHAGHYRTTKAAPELRFHPWNCHKQCQPCNTHLSGNISEYRINLVRLLGTESVEFLERKDHQPQKLTIEEIKEIKAYYKQLTKELK